MRICMILEGSYPYVHGGVSSWTHQYIQAMAEHDFVLWCIGADSRDRDNFKYTLPDNVVKVHQVFLNDALKQTINHKRVRLEKDDVTVIKSLMAGEQTDWGHLFELFQIRKKHPVSLLMSQKFLSSVKDVCREKYPYISFSEYFHTVRSMLLPELYLITQPIPEADIYHATATGYSGILGSLGKWKYKRPFIVTEHGIYTREREEELLRAKWVLPYFKKQWIHLFYSFSNCAYESADRVTCLYENARAIQQDIGCSGDKQQVIGNGIHYDRFANIPPKKENGHVDIGAIVRIAKIKDIKTMLYAFAELKSRVTNARLHILGDVDDKDYYEECLRLVEQLKIEDVIFTGVVNVIEYLENLDFTILTSISEAQPLSVLESFAAARPVVTTEVGCCRELIYGKKNDKLGQAGYCVPPMHKEELANAMERICRNRQLLVEMGQVGQQRAKTYYTHEISMSQYQKLYQEVAN